jgi:hypothetical protein
MDERPDDDVRWYKAQDDCERRQLRVYCPNCLRMSLIEHPPDDGSFHPVQCEGCTCGFFADAVGQVKRHYEVNCEVRDVQKEDGSDDTLRARDLR